MARSVIPDLKADCGVLVERFVEMESTSFLTFVELWKRQGFDMIYAGQGETEIDYFIFQVMHVAKGFSEARRSNWERVGALYLLYLLYYTQPLKVKKSIRLVPDEFKNLRSLADEFKSVNKEVSFAFYKLLLDSAFDFVVCPLPYDENLIHQKEEQVTGEEPPPSGDQTAKTLLTSLLSDTNLKIDEWTKTVSDYNNIKKKINSCCSLNLSLTKPMEEP